MKRFLIHWLIIALALWVTAYILPGVHIESNQALAIAAIVLGLVNALVRPILTLLTLPITILTLGLFYLLGEWLYIPAGVEGCARLWGRELLVGGARRSRRQHRFGVRRKFHRQGIGISPTTSAVSMHSPVFKPGTATSSRGFSWRSPAPRTWGADSQQEKECKDVHCPAGRGSRSETASAAGCG